MTSKKRATTVALSRYNALCDHLCEAQEAVRQLQERNDNQNGQLQDKLNELESLAAQRDDAILRKDQLADVCKGLQQALEQKKHDYEFRHNQALAAAHEITQLKSALQDERFQRAAELREVTRMLMLQVFPGGVSDELMVTRSRNRLLNAVAPEFQRSEEESACAVLETPKTPQQLEDETK